MLHSLDLLRAAPWRMTKAVFFLPLSFAWMFSADKLFVSKTKPGEIRLLLKSSVGSQSLIFISLFSRSIFPLQPTGIKWLVKLWKCTLCYHSHPCINSESVCVSPCACAYLSMPDSAVLALVFEVIMSQRHRVKAPLLTQHIYIIVH